MTQDKLIYEVIGASMEVYNVLGSGLLESVYEKALLYELKRKYPRCVAQDASFREYGFGATLITVK